MNKLTKRKTNKIIITIVIVLLCNFVMPNYAQASAGGLFFKPIAQFIARIADLVIQGLQAIFIGDGTIEIRNNQFKIRYSPGVIFSNVSPIFDINFINPAPDYKVKVLETKNITKEPRDYTFKWEDFDLVKEDGTCNLSAIPEIITDFVESGQLYESDAGDAKVILETEAFKGYDKIENKTVENIFKMFDKIGIEKKDNILCYNYTVNEDSIISVPSERQYRTCGPVTYNGKEYKEVELDLNGYYYWELDPEEVANGKTIEVFWYIYNFTDYDGNTTFEVYLEMTITNVILTTKYFQETEEVIESTAKQLREFIATWYKVLQEVALVGLLCVLVYVAIRMITCSVAKDKAKYKKMLIDWIGAIIIIFIMHYIISLTLAAVSSITKIFTANFLGPYDEDILMSNIRNLIPAKSEGFFKKFGEIVMYVILVIYTVLFTVQYLKRTIYIAFLTMISPLVALTYPLDKIKDGKAQAFSTWITEFIYTALIQPVHLVLYCMLVQSANSIVQEAPIYAIIVIGFLLPAEKFIKKMFKLDKASTVGSMAAALGGASVMNAINKLGTKKPGGAKGEEGSQEENGKVRTATPGTKDPYEELRRPGGPTPIPPGPTPPRPAPPAPNSRRNKTKPIKNKPSTWRGIGKVAGKGSKKLGKALVRGTANAVGAITLGTVGLAAGIATGDTKNVFAGALGGMTAGKKVVGNMIDWTSSEGKEIGKLFGEGKYGKGEYVRRKFDKEFKKSEEYKALTKKYKDQEADIQEFLNAGLTDPKQMGTALENVKNGRYNLNEAMAYMKMANAEDCPDKILYDPVLFAQYLEGRGIDSSNADTIRRGIADFK